MAAMVQFCWLVLLCMVVVAPPYAAEAGITCPQVQRSLVPCFNYLKGTAALPGNCCGGVQGLNKAARTTPDRQQVCRCLKQTYTTIPAIKPPLAAGLPGRCGVNVPYKISPSTDCSKVK